MAELVRRQDMPPPGGYKPVNYKRIPARTFFNGWTMIGGYLAMTTVAASLYYLTCKKIHHDEIENRSAMFAIKPLLLAERDREYLKQLGRNREEERTLMANVEGWKVGTWYGEPIYKLNTDDELVEPRIQDYYVHAKRREMARRMNLEKMS
ncbi:nadh dehydrogenase ubiquinone 1 alpha subcomplex subunit 13 [Holotrichia oblita]|uniref:Nadh dehydrogenase ubiquinone 1 alpha subcomplex subunit 13 n=1 Tax=Holotrichia oblita TaxID=644536 RepID=A0ACB9SWJ0_HOLOL|nr:nadh dehydrogenase ubiquinone 1 alpha subcomplex subunit 13 [Holotrichia oblita]